MSATPGRAKRLESAISICLLAILVLIGFGIFLKQRSSDISRFGLDAASAQQSAQESLSALNEDRALASLAPPGFGALSKTETYTAENLYEKINGKADFYVDAGFESLSTQRFISRDNENLWMEVYVFDMGNIRNAFSVYSRQKRPGVEALPGMQFGYKTTNALYLVLSRYYIELVGSVESDTLLASMAEAGQKARTVLPVNDDARIPELSLFPPENLVPDSAKLYLTDTFGFDGLTDTFAAQYIIGNETITAFFSKRPDTANARTVAEAYLNFLLESGGSAKPTTSNILQALNAKVVDLYGTSEVVLATGPFVAGVHEADNQQAAEKLAETIAQKLGEPAERKSND
ncbi:MAG TPA: DUF6599 family protein [Sedimentisphaerales bacterium]|nr:DUF6599 family protein [Sedimentisphaerales bacterium]